MADLYLDPRRTVKGALFVAFTKDARLPEFRQQLAQATRPLFGLRLISSYTTLSPLTSTILIPRPLGAACGRSEALLLLEIASIQDSIGAVGLQRGKAQPPLPSPLLSKATRPRQTPVSSFQEGYQLSTVLPWERPSPGCENSRESSSPQPYAVSSTHASLVVVFPSSPSSEAQLVLIHTNYLSNKVFQCLNRSCGQLQPPDLPFGRKALEAPNRNTISLGSSRLLVFSSSQSSTDGPISPQASAASPITTQNIQLLSWSAWPHNDPKAANGNNPWVNTNYSSLLESDNYHGDDGGPKQSDQILSCNNQYESQSQDLRGLSVTNRFPGEDDGIMAVLSQNLPQVGHCEFQSPDHVQNEQAYQGTQQSHEVQNGQSRCQADYPYPQNSILPTGYHHRTPKHGNSSSHTFQPPMDGSTGQFPANMEDMTRYCDLDRLWNQGNSPFAQADLEPLRPNGGQNFDCGTASWSVYNTRNDGEQPRTQEVIARSLEAYGTAEGSQSESAMSQSLSIGSTGLNRVTAESSVDQDLARDYRPQIYGHESESHPARGRKMIPGLLVPPQSQQMESLGSPSPSSSTRSVATPSTPDPLLCPYDGCDIPFTGNYRRGNRARHIRQKHTDVKIYECEGRSLDGLACMRIFKRQDARLRHYRKEHPNLRSDVASPRKSQSDRLQS
ncbi:hypothetical protein K504DRAFT_504942 [Pleomassaria siparia CBS 279.74]|uniref:C2H2-type domain-containing protein n=1 Tax=Pleomassaria siparia CBS 279.74 TaxID=1314801 RepID=A0A6G1K1X7_9PLEO|nr:hypothetical protein K504DRAFT_504942 [Pleomassaria siparia CBS 279.74]